MDLLITESCNAQCSYCLNSNYRKDTAIMAKSKLFELLDFLSGNGCKIVRLMGGEPTLHPDFKEIAQRCQDLFSKVVVLSNALSDAIREFHPRENDGIIYNFNTMGVNFDISKLLCDCPGFRYFSIVISRSSDVDNIIDRLNAIFTNKGLTKRIEINISIDLCDNIFDKTDVIRNKIDKLYLVCKENNWHCNFRFDGELVILYPECMHDIQPIPGGAKKKMCSRTEPGFVDADFNFRFCHAFPVKIMKFDSNTSWKEMCKIASIYTIERINLTRNRCKGCTEHSRNCDGTCFTLTSIDNYNVLKNKLENKYANKI